MIPTYSKEKVKALWDYLYETGKLIATEVKLEDKIIASRIDYFDGKWMHSFGSASDQEYLNYNVNDLARYYVMCKGSKLGLKFYGLTGQVKKMIINFRQKLLNTIARIEVNIDYPEYEDEYRI